jgi:hypothetical protein
MFRQVLRTPIHFHCAAGSLTPKFSELISRARKGNMEGKRDAGLLGHEEGGE